MIFPSDLVQSRDIPSYTLNQLEVLARAVRPQMNRIHMDQKGRNKIVHFWR